MDKQDWKNSSDLLKNLLKKKKEELEKIEKDIEEIKYTIECYRKKLR